MNKTKNKGFSSFREIEISSSSIKEIKLKKKLRKEITQLVKVSGVWNA